MVDGERLQPLLKELRIFTKSRPKSDTLPTRVDFVSLSKDQLTEFQERGVVIARGILKYNDLQPVIDEIAEFIDVRGLELKAAGKIDDLKKEESLLITKKNEIEDSRILLSENEYLKRISAFDIQKKILKKKYIN